MFFILTFAALLILPGFFLVSLLTPQLPWFQRLPAGFALSVALLGLPAVLLLNLHAPLSVLGWLTFVVTLILGGLYLKKALPNSKSTNQPNQPINQFPNSPIPLLLITLLAAALALYLFLKTAAIRDFGDHWFYLHFIRHYLDFPLDPALNPLAGQGAAPGTLVRAATNGWWVLIALVVQVSDRPLLDAYWLFLPPVLMVMSLFAFYGLAWELFENHRAGLTAVLLQLLLYLTTIGSHDWIGQGFFTRIVEDKYVVWLLLLPVSFMLLLRYIKTNQWRFLILLAGSVAALAITHPFGLFQFAFAVACFALVHLLFNFRKITLVKSAVLLAPLLLFLIIPIVQYLSSDAAPLLQFAPTELQTAPNDTHLMVLSAENNRYLLHPHLIFHPLMLIGIVLSPLLLVKIKRHVAAQFLFSTTLIPLLLLYNPITAPFFGRFISPLLLWRITWILPTTLVTAYFLDKIARWVGAGLVSAQGDHKVGDHKGRPYREWVGKGVTAVRASVVVIIMVVGLAFSLSVYIRDGVDLLQDYETRRITDGQEILLDYLCEGAIPDGVLIADPALNTLLPACAPQISLLTYRIFQARPSAAEEIDRFYQSRLVTQATIDFLQKWQAQYVIVPHQVPVAEQIALIPEIFLERYTNDNFSLYEFTYFAHPVIQGNDSFIRGELSQAAIFYNQALARNLSPALAHYGLGQTYLAQGNVGAAETAFRQAVEGEAAFTSPYISLAALLSKNGRPAEVEALLMQALATNPRSAALHEAMGDWYLASGNHPAAAKQYQMGIIPATNSLDETLAMGNLYREKGLTEPAVAAYETIIHTESGLFRLSGGPGFWPAWNRSLTFDRRPERLQAALLAMGQIYEQREDREAAETAYRQLIRLLPTREIGYRTLAALLNESGRQGEAIALYEEAAQINFHLTWPYLRLAEGYLAQFEADSSQSDNLTKASAALQRAEQIEPGNMESQHLLARFYQLRNQPQQATAVYQEAADQYSWAAWPLVSLGQYYLDGGDFEAAESALTAAITRQPAEQTAYNLLADAYINRQQSDQAVQIYQTAVSANGDRAWPYLGLGNAYLAAGENDLALAALRDGLAREPDSAAVYATLGNIYRWNVGDPETAVTYYRQSIALDPTNADAHIALASTLIALGREADAETYYRQALALDGRNAFAHLGLSRIYRQQEAYETALEHAQQAVHFSQSPHASGPAHMEQGQIYLTLGRPEEALPHFLAAVEALPADPWFRATVGDYYHYQQNDPAAAVPHYQEAAELAPQQAILQAALGTALYDAGQVAKAIPVMEAAVALGPHDAAVFLRIGSVLNKYGDWEQLVVFYETAAANNIQNADIYTQLGNAYSTLGQQEKAQIQYEKAAALEGQ